ncbi:tRNA (N(6)-L-threonylcarbamoyladenosine(37)-C(2))-methylthiotransferase MtaB [Cryomorpha ignava]|uniref:Threonylcarbamoyladenosine tRNA methylthiotransferase MtaB n=1 Tax=Cryomorpha ignava TaxID=101383 RepID=A0A7K3WNI0_9FLAO|nr:tRNA (N(6)-L-threonylcarbamoyladenosine(37)-C(2))-methylthiotransferase MtaB [Cryomorpha ignava]NEN23213.1 tRNA (N(6)-L-threonylcarbamoyladenosine(37)-C(2))-methylthiotransferase MtaB [Cryomorpha ignava]
MLQFKKVAFYTLGCKLNFSETSTIARQLTDAGYARVKFDDNPDVFVINTCSVTDNADKKCRSIVRKALRVNPEAVVIVIGCYAQLKPGEIAEIEGVNLVLGAEEKFNVAAYLESDAISEKNQTAARAIKHTREFVPGFSSGDRTRTFLKVQDGCNYFCAFCTIPLARGRSRSANVEETLKIAREAADAGAKEVVLTGVNIGDFGHGTDENLIDLLRELELVDGIERFRISSIEPNLLTNEIITFVAESKKFVPHFHIPLQSGSDSVLTAMRRRYRTDLYRDRIETIKRLMPNACIGVDVIVGFPGETEADFNDTYLFLRDLDISYLHVFTYSERPNTTALRIDAVVPIETRQERNKMLRILSEKKQKAFYGSQLNATSEVLFEAEENGGQMYGFTKNYVKVKTPFDESLINKIKTVKLESIDSDGVGKIQLINEPQYV